MTDRIYKNRKISKIIKTVLFQNEAMFKFGAITQGQHYKMRRKIIQMYNRPKK